MLSTFYIPFSTLAIPGVMLTRKIGPRWTIPGYIFGWSAMVMLNVACTNFAGVLVIWLRKLIIQRWRSYMNISTVLTLHIVLGVFEAGFAASLIFYLTTFYTRGELGTRISVFYSCQALSGSFSGCDYLPIS